MGAGTGQAAWNMMEGLVDAKLGTVLPGSQTAHWGMGLPYFGY